MAQETGIDHVTLCVENLEAAEYLFTKVLGFDVIWSAKDIGTEKSSMDTVLLQRGAAKIALVQGRDKAVKSQISEFLEKYGQGVHHVAIEVDDIEAVSSEWESQGVKFIGPLKEGRDGFGPLKQRFTYPLFPGCGVFIELTQRQQNGETSKTFVPGSVEALYRDMESDQLAGVEQTIIDYDRDPDSTPPSPSQN